MMNVDNIIYVLLDKRLLTLWSLILVCKWILTNFTWMAATPFWILPALVTVGLVAAVIFDPKHNGAA